MKPAIQPRARLIVIQGGTHPCMLVDRVLSGLTRQAPVLHDTQRFMEYIYATTHCAEDLLAIQRLNTKPLDKLQQLWLLDRYCRYFTDLKIWLDENPNRVIVVNGCSFLEDIHYRLQNQKDAAEREVYEFLLQSFLTRFEQLFAHIPTLSVYVNGSVDIHKHSVYLKWYQDACTYATQVDNTHETYFKLTIQYNLFDWGQL